jgi:hypothetical protein
MRKLTVAVIAVLALTGGVAAAKNGEFFIQRADLTKQPDGSWSGPGTLDGVKGTLTITGKLDPAADAVEVGSSQGRHRLLWTWVAGRRRVTGCAIDQILIRPQGVRLWDGSGRITRVSAQERKYQGRRISLSGPTSSGDLTRAQISVRQAPAGFPTRPCR